MSFKNKALHLIFSQLRLPGGVEAQTLSATLVLDARSAIVLALDANGANRNVDLQVAESCRGCVHAIKNTATGAYNLVLRDGAGGSTVATVNQNEWALVASDGADWHVLAFSTFADLLATANAWALRQTFSTGITTLDLIFGAATAKVIASGVIAATQSVHTLTGEGAVADQLDTITGGTTNQVLFVRPTTAGTAITLAHAVGANCIACPGGQSIVLTQAYDWAQLIFNGTQWVVLAFSAVAATGAVGAVLTRLQNGLTARSQLTALVADLAALRTPIAASVVDLGVLRTPIVAALVDLAAVFTRNDNSAVTNGNIANGSTNGKLKTSNPVDFRINGTIYTNGGTDNLWILSGQSATDGTHYRAIALYLASDGTTATIGAGSDQLSAALAIAALPVMPASKSLLGVFVANPSCTFTNALSAQGTIYNGQPGAYALTAAAPVALTAAAPAAMTATTTTGISNGTTNGRLCTKGDSEYRILGVDGILPATDNLWNLSAETATSGAQFRAYLLYQDGTFGAGANAASLAAAVAALPAVTTTKAVIGVFVAGLSTNFANALSSQGTVYNGWPGTAF